MLIMAHHEAVPGLVSEQDGPLLRIRFDRPGKRNSFTDDMVAELTGLVQAAGNDESVRAVLGGNIYRALHAIWVTPS